MSLTQLRREVRIVAYSCVARLGAAGLFGVVLSTVAVLSAVVILTANWSRHRDLQRQMVLVHANAVLRISSVEPTRAPPVDESVFPSLFAVPGILSEVMQKAHEQGLAIGSGDYHWSPASTSAPAQYEFSFAFSGSYLAARQFVRAVLNAQPAVALRELSFSREKVTDPELNVRTRFVIFLSPQP